MRLVALDLRTQLDPLFHAQEEQHRRRAGGAHCCHIEEAVGVGIPGNTADIHAQHAGGEAWWQQQGGERGQAV